MSNKLSEVYPWASDRHVQSKVVLLLDSQIPGSNHTAEFLLTTFLLRYLSPKAARDSSSSLPVNIVMVLCNHNLRHYEAIMRKNVSHTPVEWL
ncbi:hypothetical protein EON65_25115 [archaeon]|nr:MAG: hypothetical protein EON65_25115 [archaeon]